MNLGPCLSLILVRSRPVILSTRGQVRAGGGVNDKGCEVRGGIIMQDSGRNHKRLEQKFEFNLPNYLVFVLCDLFH